MQSSRSLFVMCLSVTAMGFGLLSACSSATGGGTKTDFCGSKYLDPLLLNDDGTTINSKTVLKTGTAFTPAAGDYAYQSGFIYYNDIANDIRFMVSETHDSNGNLTPPSVICVGGRGGDPNMAAKTYSIPFVSDIQSDGTTVKVRSRILNVEMGPPANPADKFFRPTIVADKATFMVADPTTTYSDVNNKSAYFPDVTQTFNNVTIRNSPFNFAMGSYLNRPAQDKFGKASIQNVRVLIYMQTVSPEVRDKIDHPPTKEKPKP